MSYATPSDLPPRPSQPRDGNQLRNNVNGRENLVVCLFYTRIGACRHGENCSKKHIRPNSSNTIMLANLYQNPKVKKSNNTDNGSEQLIPASESGKTEVEMANEEEPQEDKEEKLQQQKEVEESEVDPTEEEIQEYFDQFYADVFVHISQMRPIYKLSVCENQNDHLNGNVYVQFFSEEDAGFVNRQLNSEWFNERPVYSELSPVSDFEEAHCRAYDNGGCDRGGRCNYMHVRQPTEELFDELFRCQQKSAFQKRLGNLKEICSKAEHNTAATKVSEHTNENNPGTTALLEQLS